jgi:hypothetical protein
LTEEDRQGDQGEKSAKKEERGHNPRNKRKKERKILRYFTFLQLCPDSTKKKEVNLVEWSGVEWSAHLRRNKN